MFVFPTPGEVRRSCRIQVPRSGRIIGERGHLKSRLTKTVVRFPERGYVTSDVKEATSTQSNFTPSTRLSLRPKISGRGKAGQRDRKHPAENHCGCTLKSTPSTIAKTPLESLGITKLQTGGKCLDSRSGAGSPNGQPLRGGWLSGKFQ